MNTQEAHSIDVTKCTFDRSICVFGGMFWLLFRMIVESLFMERHAAHAPRFVNDAFCNRIWGADLDACAFLATWLDFMYGVMVESFIIDWSRTSVLEWNYGCIIR